MAHPEFYPEGTTPRIGDTRYRRWMKMLGAKRNQNLGTAANNPRSGDTLRRVKLKLLGTIRGE